MGSHPPFCTTHTPHLPFSVPKRIIGKSFEGLRIFGKDSRVAAVARTMGLFYLDAVSSYYMLLKLQEQGTRKLFCGWEHQFSKLKLDVRVCKFVTKNFTTKHRKTTTKLLFSLYEQDKISVFIYDMD